MGSLPPDKDRSGSGTQMPDEPEAPSREHDVYVPSRSASLSADQLEYYRQRIESGFYRSPEVIRHIAERVTDDLLSPEDKRRR